MHSRSNEISNELVKEIIESDGALKATVGIVDLLIFSSILLPEQNQSLRSAGLQPSSATIFPSHITPAPASSHQPGNSIFLSHHSSSSLQLQPAERSVWVGYKVAFYFVIR